MELISIILQFVGLILVLFAGFGLIYESFSETSFFPKELVISSKIARPIGIVVSLTAVFVIVYKVVIH